MMSQQYHRGVWCLEVSWYLEGIMKMAPMFLGDITKVLWWFGSCVRGFVKVSCLGIVNVLWRIMGIETTKVNFISSSYMFRVLILHDKIWCITWWIYKNEKSMGDDFKSSRTHSLSLAYGLNSYKHFYCYVVYVPL